MINVFKLKRIGAILMACYLPTVCFYIGVVTKNLFWGIGLLAGASLVMILASGIMLKNPFTDMLEGKGILALNWDSTGIIQPFLVRIKQPYLLGNLNGKNIRDVFDRKTVNTITMPKIAEKKAELTEDGGIKFNLTAKDLNAAKHGLYQFPLLIWNSMLGCFMTKEMISDIETSSFAEHHILYMNRQMEELTSQIRDFGRYIIEALKPAMSIFRSPWFWIIIIVFVGIIALMFAPAIIGELKGFVGGATETIGSTVNPGGAVIPGK